MMAVELPWPDRALHPNSRPHWAAKAKAAAKARYEAAWWARAAGVRKIDAEALSVTAIFYPPDKRRRDADGLLASIKSALDGIADVIGVDDHRWQIAVRRAEPRAGGAVRIEIAEVAA